MKKAIKSLFLTIILFSSIFPTQIIYAKSDEEKSVKSTKELNEAIKQENEVIEHDKNQIKITKKNIKKNKEKLAEVQQEMVENQKEITKIEKELPQLENNSKKMLEILQQVNNTNIAMKIMGESSQKPKDFITAMHSYQYLLNSVTKSLQELIIKKQELDLKKNELNQKKEYINALQEELEEQLTKMQDRTKNKYTAEAEKKTRAFYEKNGCETGDVYGKDCGRGKIKEEKKIIKPLSTGYVTNEFHGYDVYNQADGHTGIDLAGGDQVVYPAAGGKVVAVFTDPYGGTQVTMIHYINGKNYVTNYAHLSEIKVVEGQTLKANQPLGIQGETGVAFGVHLHFEIIEGPFYIHSKLENPRKYLKFPNEYQVFEERE